MVAGTGGGSDGCHAMRTEVTIRTHQTLVSQEAMGASVGPASGGPRGTVEGAAVRPKKRPRGLSSGSAIATTVPAPAPAAPANSTSSSGAVVVEEDDEEEEEEEEEETGGRQAEKEGA